GSPPCPRPTPPCRSRRTPTGPRARPSPRRRTPRRTGRAAAAAPAGPRRRARRGTSPRCCLEVADEHDTACAPGGTSRPPPRAAAGRPRGRGRDGPVGLLVRRRGLAAAARRARPRAEPGDREDRVRERAGPRPAVGGQGQDRKSTRLNSSHVKISYAVFCLKKKKQNRMQV